MQVELVTFYGAATQTMWLNNFMDFIVDSMSRPITIHCDNSDSFFFIHKTIKALVVPNI